MQKKVAVTASLNENRTRGHLKYPILDLNCLFAILLVSYAALVLSIVLNVTFLSPLFFQGLNFIYSYQNAEPQEGIRAIQNLISYLSHPILVAVVIIVYFLISKRRLLVIVHLLYYFFFTYLVAILVEGIQQTRPFGYDTRIKFLQWNCQSSFGNPSGHCYSIIVLYQPILSDFTGCLRWKVLAIPLFILWAVMPLSRMYLGMHSANQVLFGVVLGMILLILYKYIYQRELYLITWQFLARIRPKLKILAALLLHVFVIVIPIIFFLTGRPVDQRQIENLNKQCGVTDITNKRVIEDMFVSGCSIGSLCFGLLYGFIFLARKQKYQLYYLGKWYYRSKIKIVVLILLQILCGGVPFVVFFLISQFAVQNSPIGDYFLYTGGFVCGGIGITCLIPILAYKLNLITSSKPTGHPPSPAHSNQYINQKVDT